jgi:hypothetical protein
MSRVVFMPSSYRFLYAPAPDKVGDARTNDPHVALDRPQARRQHERPRPGTRRRLARCHRTHAAQNWHKQTKILGRNEAGLSTLR